MKNRSNLILEILTEQTRVEVSHLAKLLNVSQVTIRKDLDALELRGIIHREHGFAVLRSSDDINGRIAYHYEEKLLIAQEAAKLINDGETIMIESGSCCSLLADTILSLKKDITIITNSAFIANYIRHRPNAKIILLGGIYQNESQVMVGPMIKEASKNFYVDKLFIGTDGYNPKIGFTNSDQLRAQAVRDMSQQAEQIIILTESTKFAKNGVIPLNLHSKITTVITDKNIADNYLQILNSQNITVIKA